GNRYGRGLRCLGGDATTTPNGTFCGGCRFGIHFRCRSRGRGSPTPTRSCRWRCNPRALLTLPASANTGNLIVTQWAQMAANGNVHLAKQIDYLVTGNSKLACQVVHSKLAQTTSSFPTLGISSAPMARRPFANPLSTIPITAVASRPAAAPN